MARITEEQIRLVSGNYTNFEDYLNRRTVKPSAKTSVNEFTLASAAQFKLLDAPTHVAAGVISKNAVSNPSNSSNNGGVVAAALTGAVGTAANSTTTDSTGDILNIVEIRDGATNNEITAIVGGTERKVWGLVQCSNTVTDGDAIGSSGSENLQISFAYYDSSDALTLYSLPAGTYEFHVNRLYIERNMPSLTKEGGSTQRDVLDLKLSASGYAANYAVTTEFPANDVIDLATGDGTTGVSTATGDAANVAFPATSADFNANPRVRILRNGVQQVKGDEVIYNSSTSFHFVAPIRSGEVFSVETPAVY